MPAYLAGWDNRAKIVIDHTKIDAALVDFPVAIPISASCGQGDQDLSAVFDELELDANRTKIAVTTDDGQTQCYVEIENWDDANELAMLHVKVPAISADEDTILYLYYDAEQAANTDFVGDTGDTPALDVWDDNFVAVYHMAQDPNGDGADAIKDSTDNSNDGTPDGTMTTADLVAGLEGARGIDFDGTDDLINIGTATVIDDVEPIFIESVFNADSYGGGGFGRVFAKAGTTSDGIEILLRDTEDAIMFFARASTTDGQWITPNDSLEVATDYYVGIHFDRSSAPASHVDPVIYLNGTVPSLTEPSTPAGSWELDAGYNGLIGNRGATDRGFDGIISEIRLSDVDRGAAWAKATYHTLFDTLITWQTVDFDNRFKIVIDHSKIDADLTDFPVMIKISDDSGKGGADLTAVFDELTTDAERVKIAVTTSDGDTQCPVEIEYWDVATETAILHVKVPAVDDDVSTVLYLYYDADVPDNTLFVGDTGDAIAQEVWDSDYQGVYVFSDTADDSTDNDNDLTEEGTPTYTDGQKGRAIDFDGSERAYASGKIFTGTVGQIDMLVKIDALENADKFMGIGGNNVASPAVFGPEMRDIGGSDFRFGVIERSDGGSISYVYGNTSLAIDTWYHLILQSTGTAWAMRLNDVSQSLTVGGGSNNGNWWDDITIGSGAETSIGATKYDGAPTSLMDGQVEHARISSIVRSDAWNKATYETLFDTLLSFGTTKGYLPGFNNRVQVDIDSDLIDADLTDFPVTLHLSEAAGISGLDMRRVFEVIQASGDNKKIAVTTADGLTQCPVEIEYWDHASKTAVLHVKVPHVESSADTVLYLYFDNSAADNDSFVGDTGDAVAQGVWDDNFVAVYHMATDPSGGSAFLDSTENGLDGTMAGTMLTEDLIDGDKAKAIAFDGSDDYFSRADTALLDLNGSEDVTIEAIFRRNAQGTSHTIFDKRLSTGAVQGWLFGVHSANTVRMYMKDTGADSIEPAGATIIANDTWYYGGGRLDKTGDDDADIWLNDADDVAAPTSSSAIGDCGNTTPSRFGSNSVTSSWTKFNGDIGEIRVSKAYRSDAWMKATYYSLFGTLVTFSNFQSSDFKKRRKITIDSDLIDEPLVDFPLAIPLGTSAGIGDEDLSDIFAELKFPASDAFYGGSAFDTTRWEVTGQTGNVSMVDNALQCYVDSGDTASERQGVLSKFKLDYTEDFDIRVDFEITAGPATNTWQATLEAYFFDQAGGSVGGAPSWDTGAICSRVYDSANGGHFIQGVAIEDTAWKTSDRDLETATKGRLRLVYNATTPSITPYHDVGAGWVSHGAFTFTDVDATDALICLAMHNSSSSPTATAKFTNFDVYEGVVKWPDGEPNRKKLKVTLDDLITECPVEIEHLDIDGQVGILHTKIPYLSAAEDTEIYLHYDCDQPDNSNVGDTGDAIAQTVWDEYFVAVYHLAEDPTGGADCILDSTDNGKTLTPSGSMTAGDLVDSQPGKGLDFDGSNDHVTRTDAVLSAFPATLEVAGPAKVTAASATSPSCNLADNSSAAQFVTLHIHDGYGRSMFTNAYSNKGTTLLVEGEFCTLTATFIDATDRNVFTNGANKTQDTNSQVFPTGLDRTSIGASQDSSPVYFAGQTSEARFSNIVRSDAWILATYHTLADTLLTWSDPDRAAPWLGTWAKRRKFTISAALVDAELVDFPIALPIDASCGIGADDLSGLFTAISTANKKKMAITLGDKLTECYFELENWDSDNSKGIIHTRGPILRLGKDTELYIYYDSAQSENAKAGVPGDAIAANVWDDDFVGVWHMSVFACPDSTAYGNDCAGGGGDNNPTPVDGLNGALALDFDEVDDAVNVGTAAVLDDLSLLTVESIINADDYGEGASGRIVDKTVATNLGWSLLVYTPGVRFIRMSGVTSYWSAGTLSSGTWQHFAVTHDVASINNDPEMFQDGEPEAVTEGQAATGSWVSDASGEVRIGKRADGDREFDGKIGEVRISDVIRSDAWIKATYKALFDALGTWSAEEEIVAVTDDVYAIVGTPEITYSVPAALAGVSVEPGAPAEITYSVPGAAVVSIGAIVGTPEITYSVPAATVVQNLNAIGIMSKPNVSAKKPSATVTARRPSATATGSGPSATVTAKGD